MIQVSLDTSFLISFADPSRPHHAIAVDYFRHCLAQRIPMWISVIAAGEFEVKQSVSDLQLQYFRIQPYNLPHAICAAALLRSLQADSLQPVENNARRIVINDLKIIAQAEEEKIPVILTEDANTLSKIVARLRQANATSTHVLLLKDGFTPGKLENPDQNEFTLPSSTA
ncbi:MAG: type II toxin-antitoxin system VapC family toxin [Verrucomicrobiota bacterium]